MSNGYDRPTNGMGLAGFIVSLVGLFTGGCLSPIGLVLSIVGLLKEPRGFAVAGLVISLLAVLGWVVGFIFLGVGAIAVVLGTLGLTALMGEAQVEFETIEAALQERYAEVGAYPSDLDGLGLAPEVLRNADDVPYQYTALATGFELRDAGNDGVAGTADDTVLTYMRLPGGGYERSFESWFYSESDSGDAPVGLDDATAPDQALDQAPAVEPSADEGP